MSVRTTILEQKNKLIEIVNSFEEYYLNNHLLWEIKEVVVSHQILGILILTFKKTESMEKSIEYFEDNGFMENFNFELDEVIIITDFYYDAFVTKKGT